VSNTVNVSRLVCGNELAFFGVGAFFFLDLTTKKRTLLALSNHPPLPLFLSAGLQQAKVGSRARSVARGSTQTPSVNRRVKIAWPVDSRETLSL